MEPVEWNGLMVTRGRPRWVGFTSHEGGITQRWLVPLLDDQGAWVAWVEPTAEEWQA